MVEYLTLSMWVQSNHVGPYKVKEGDRRARDGRDVITEADAGVMWPRAKELSFYMVEKAREWILSHTLQKERGSTLISAPKDPF